MKQATFDDLLSWLRWISAEDLWWYIRRPFAVLRRLPLVKCPACHGAGGEMEGYEQREWVECPVCWKRWEALADDYGFEWAAGRINPLFWPWAKLRGSTTQYTFREWLACRLGWHLPNPDGFCRRCFYLPPQKRSEVLGGEVER